MIDIFSGKGGGWWFKIGGGSSSQKPKNHVASLDVVSKLLDLVSHPTQAIVVAIS